MLEQPAGEATGVATIAQGDEVQVISGFRDENGAIWYLVQIGSNKGYVPAESIMEATNADTGGGLVKTNTERKRRLDWTGVVEADAGGLAIPKVYQFDFRATLCYYGGVPRSVSRSGCNVTCISMVTAYLTGNTNQTPEVLFDWAVDNGLYYGNGLGHREMSAVAAHWGVGTRWIPNDASLITGALQQGYPVIAHMGPGLFTREGHYIVLRGVTDSGKILVNDPNSKSNSSKAFPISRILNEVRLSGSSFMVCYPPDGLQEQ